MVKLIAIIIIGTVSGWHVYSVFKRDGWLCFEKWMIVLSYGLCMASLWLSILMADNNILSSFLRGVSHG